ncbi:MAG TPA: AI-2E family transporter [Candidatus Aquilonibacter sp.]|nr:AI-2E family transporter [Candidatus Aquilonibacter sp.]
MASSSPQDVSASSKAVVFIAFVLAIAALYAGRQVFIPVALALVLSFLLTPVVTLLEKIHFGRLPAVLTVLVLSFAFMGAVTWGVASQLVQIMVELPDYKENLDLKIQALHSQKNGNLSKATATVQELNKELTAVPGEISANLAKNREQATRSAHPISVQVAQPPTGFVEDLRSLLGPLAGPLETAAIVIIFTLFMLIKREDLRNRAIRLAGRGKLNVMTQALDDAGRRLSRYLLLQCLVNAGYGLLFGIALYFVGVPHALLWGVFAGVMRFVPYIGSLIAAIGPIAMALAVFPGWHHAGLAFAFFVILELLVSNVVEPLLYGAHTGISSLAILVAAVFWATLWGPVGLILSTPLTVCLIVLGRHVPQLNFLEVVLGDEPVLLPEQCIYQRLLATDMEEARAVAENYLKENSLENLYELVILPALKLAEHDRRASVLGDSAKTFVFESMKEMIEYFGDVYGEPQTTDAEDGESRPQEFLGNAACVPATSGADELVAMMLGQLLRRSNCRAGELKPGSPEEIAASISHGDYRMVVVSSISSISASEARVLCKKLGGISGLHIVMGLWSFESNMARQRLGLGCTGFVTTSLSEAIGEVRRIADPLSAAQAVTESSEA